MKMRNDVQERDIESKLDMENRPIFFCRVQLNHTNLKVASDFSVKDKIITVL